MIPRALLLVLIIGAVVADLPPVNSRQQRIVRRPQDFSGDQRPRPGGPPPPPRGLQNNGQRQHGPPGPKPVPPPPAAFNRPRVPPPPPNKKPFFNPPRPKLPSPVRTSDKAQPQVEYGFTPIVAPNGFNNAAPSQHDLINSENKNQQPLVINVQPASTSFQNNNQNKQQNQNGPQKHNVNFSQQGNFGQGQVFNERPNEQYNFDQVKKQQQQQQHFGPNGNKNSEPFPKIPPNFSHFGGENKNVQQNFDSVPKASGNVQVQKVPLVASFQTTSIGHSPDSQNFNKPQQQNSNFNINKPQSQNPNFNIHKPQSQNPNFNINKPPQNPNFNINKPPQPQNPNFNIQGQRAPQFQEGKILSTGAQFQVQGDNKFPPQNKNIPTHFPQGNQQHFVNNFGPEKKFQTNIPIQGNFGQHVKHNGGQFLQETTFQNQNVGQFAANNVNFQVQHPQYFNPEIKVIPHAPQQAQLQDPKFSNAQFFNQDPKILSAGIPVGAQFNVPQLHNQQLHAQYQVQAETPANFQYFPTQFKTPAAPGQIYGQKSLSSNQDQISIPVATTFPFGFGNNPFNKGIVQGQVIPVGHLGIPQFATLPQTLQYTGVPVGNVHQTLGKEQEVAASQTLRKIIAPPRNTSAISPAKSKKTTLKDILAEDCTGAEEFGYCASPPRYPTLQVTAILKQCSEQIQELYEPESVVAAPSHHISERANTEAWSWSAYDNAAAAAADGSEATCESTTAIVEPGYARDANGHWLVVLQHPTSNVHQRVSVDVCAHEGGSCGCEQRYESKNLIAWDPDTPNQCPSIKSFKFPTKCICPGEKTDA